MLFQPPTVKENPVPSQPAPSPGPDKTAVTSGDGSTESAPVPAETKAPRKAAARKAAPRKTTTSTKTTNVTNATSGGGRTPRKAASADGVAVPTVTPRSGPAGSPDPERVQPRTPELDGPAIVARLLDHPGYAPELLALAAVDALGPGARRWAGQLRAAYPTAPPAGLARLAVRRFSRLAAAGGAASIAAGLFAPVAGLATTAWTRAGLVLHLAAAYDWDPTHPDRAVDLLVLTGVHLDDEAARSALAAAQATLPEEEQPIYRLAAAAGRLATPLAVQAGSWLSLRAASRLLPGAALLGAVAGGSAGIHRLAARTIAHYRDTKTG